MNTPAQMIYTFPIWLARLSYIVLRIGRSRHGQNHPQCGTRHDAPQDRPNHRKTGRYPRVHILKDIPRAHMRPILVKLDLCDNTGGGERCRRDGPRKWRTSAPPCETLSSCSCSGKGRWWNSTSFCEILRICRSVMGRRLAPRWTFSRG